MKTVLVTRSKKQSQPFANALEKAGFEAVFFPTIQIRPLEDLSALGNALTQIERYAWIIFSSVNAVDVFFNAVGVQHAESLRQQQTKIAAIGTKTVQALQAHGVDADFVPEKYVGESLLAGLGDLRGKWVLLPRAKVARELVPQEIVKAGGIVHEIAIYETLPAELDESGLSALRAGVDAVTFTSPSTVKNFVKLTQNAHLDPLNLPNNPLFACIGPVTEKAAREMGFSPLVVAERYTTDGLIDILGKHEGHEGTRSF